MIQKVVNILGSDAAHNPMTKEGKNVVVEIGAIAVIGIGREPFFSCVVWEPFFNKFPVGFLTVVLS